MKQIKEFNCYCTDLDATIKNRYVGKVALENDGFFEGILIDPNTRRDYLAFGYYREGIVLNIVKGICDNKTEYPKEMRVRKKERTYKGQISIKASFADFPTGVCEVEVFQFSKTRKEQKEELQKLQHKTELLKNSMNKETKEVYDRCMPKQELKEKRKVLFR